MLDKETRLPNGFGRIVKKDKQWMADGQFKHGSFHGYIRVVKSNGLYINQEYKNGVTIREWN